MKGRDMKNKQNVRVGDKVYHKDYPKRIGRIVVSRALNGGKPVYEVEWEGRGPEGKAISRHIGDALKPVEVMRERR